MEPWTWQDELAFTCVGAVIFGFIYLAYYIARCL